MAITKEYLTGLGIEEETVNKIFTERGKEVEKDKEKLTKVSEELAEAKSTIQTLTTEAETLKTNGANADEWKSKFETLQTEIAEKEKTAKEEQAKAEREANILARYNSVSVDKDGNPLEWSHDAIKTSYLQKFTEALGDETNTGKSDADIFKALTNDDVGAFKTAQPIVQLKGAAPLNVEGITKEAFTKMGYAERTQLYSENPKLYNELKGE